MKIKHFFVGAGLSLALALGVGLAIAPKEAVKAEAVAAGTKIYLTKASGISDDFFNYGVVALWNHQASAFEQFTSDTDSGYYAVELAAACTSFNIFRGSALNWDNKWDQSGNGAFEDGKNLIKVTSWSGGSIGFTWETYTPGGDPDPEPTPVYSLIGDYTGHSWSTDQDMTVDTATTTATLNNVPMAKGNSFKIRKDHAWTTTYGWSAANGHENVTDPLNRGEPCFGDAGPNDHNIAVLHNGTYNFSLNYSTGVLTITGTRDASDSSIPFEIYISNGGAYAATEMALKAGSDSEYMITRDFAAGEKFYLKFGSSYYHYSDFKENEGTLKGIQFIADGQDAKALYSGNYTIYFETDTEGNNFGGWFQYNSVSSAQVRENVVAYAQYFNSEVGGACDIQGKTTVIANLQAAWGSVKTRFDNAPANDIRTAIKAATASDTDEDVAEFVEKYASVYELRGNNLGTQGGDFLQKGITPRQSGIALFGINSETGSDYTWIIAVIAVASLVAVGGVFFIRKRKDNN